MTLPRLYEVGEEIAGRLAETSFLEQADSIFEPAKNSVAERMQRGFNWMTRARHSADLAERFLFGFTALEALLSSDDKNAPVIDTIARRAGTMFAEHPDARFRGGQAA